MDRLDAMHAFTRIVERRSFTGAAQDLGYSRSTLTEAIKALEARLGTRLLQRTTRSVRPTQDGEAYYRHCRDILERVDAAEVGVGARPQGTLRVDMHGTLARHFVLPRLAEFIEAYPEVTLVLSEGDRLVDLVQEGIDCVLRVGTPQDSDLVARRITLLDEVTVAAPGYLARQGTPRTLAELKGHCMVGFRSSQRGRTLALEFTREGRLEEIMLPATVTMSAAESYYAAALLGLGIIQVPRYHAANDLRAGRLVELLPNMPPSPSPVSLLYPSQRQLPSRVRVFIDWIVRVFAEQV
ncbi:LysR family transcriptional regulator [Halomonas dongshanensis]|uniref:LysR family transcriptional regulator n=1 Tax=Halomonas dongshanensis TaxID=2890835 RepID=A0ABT2EB35_9GAMM|nr:LysR family transcriptional regulator [Halomonas dongshanensis]MCS2608785.1 LysR family transcriptional regulator [Halomonas dongshanensis]